MSRRCLVTGKAVLVGNTVSHANNKTKRRYLPNLQSATLFSESLQRSVNVRITVSGLRTIDHKGGLDAYLMDTAATKLDDQLRPLKGQVEKAMAAKVPA